jgi:hypothetical protein
MKSAYTYDAGSTSKPPYPKLKDKSSVSIAKLRG